MYVNTLNDKQIKIKVTILKVIKITVSTQFSAYISMSK